MERYPTIAVPGEIPFENYGKEVAYYNIVATKIVSNAIQIHLPELLLQNEIVLLKPRLLEYQYLVHSSNKRSIFVTIVKTIINNGGK